MRGRIDPQATFLCAHPEALVPAGHPIRPLRALCFQVLRGLEPVFQHMYDEGGRPSIPPERLLMAQLLISLFSVRSERLFCQELGYNFLYRWFLSMDGSDSPFDPTVFTKNRDRLLEHKVCELFFAGVVDLARQADLLSSEHFTVDGTMIEAWASMKSFKPKPAAEAQAPATAPEAPTPDMEAALEVPAQVPLPGIATPPTRRRGRNPDVDFRGQKRKNDTHASTTDPEARLYRKSNGTTAKMAYLGHALMENRHGMLVDFRVTTATGTAERDAALDMIDRHTKKVGPIATLGADKGFDTKNFVIQVVERGIKPHIAANEYGKRRSTISMEIRNSEGYALSGRLRKRVEEIFGWSKTYGGLRKTRFVGLAKTQDAAYMVGAAYNLTRMAKMKL